MSADIPDSDQTAVSLYDQDGALDDFPVLKAFQQYIDAEQDKARRRMLSLCIFFGCLMTVVVAVFVVLMMHISSRNQALNDRMIELAMKRGDVAASSSPVVVQPPQDSAAILALTTKLDNLQKKLIEDQIKAEKSAADAIAKAERAAAEAVAKAEQAAIEAAKPKVPTAEEIEIKKLKALLQAEKDRNSEEKERLRQAELEAYRRKHYPELYEKPVDRRAKVRTVRFDEDEDDDTQELLDLVDERTAKTYFDEEDDEKKDVSPAKRVAKPKAKETPTTSSKAAEQAPVEDEKEYSIPVDVKGSSIRWNIPND